MSLMNGARIGIAAQGLGIGEAAYRVARDYAHSRKQFDTAIENFPAVRELLVDMSLDLQAARALTYYAAFCVDLEHGALRKLEFGHVTDDSADQGPAADSRKYGRYNKLLTPMAKYYASEMSMRVSNSAMAVLGGSGYMKDYPVERHLRDSRITTIYEGTSQLQVVAAVAGMASGTCQTLVEELIGRSWPEELAPLVEQIRTRPGAAGAGRRGRQGPGSGRPRPVRPQAGGHRRVSWWSRRCSATTPPPPTARRPSPGGGWRTSCPRSARTSSRSPRAT